jgi:hypothetical protein
LSSSTSSDAVARMPRLFARAKPRLAPARPPDERPAFRARAPRAVGRRVVHDDHVVRRVRSGRGNGRRDTCRCRRPSCKVTMHDG